MILWLLACATGKSAPTGSPDEVLPDTTLPSDSTTTTVPPVPPPPVTPAGPLDCHAYDQDEDGVDLCADCDDTDPNTWPGAPAVCFDGRNNSCGAEEEAPCPLTGVYTLGTAGVSLNGSRSVAEVTLLWGRVALTDLDRALPAPPHSGDFDLQDPFVITPDTEGQYYEGAGDVTGDGLPDVYFGSGTQWDLRLIRPNPDDPSQDIRFQPSAAYFVGISGDADGDGISDVALQDTVSGDVYVYTAVQPGATYTPEDAKAAFRINGCCWGYGYFHASEDIDGDGLVEVISVWGQHWWDTGNPWGVVGVFQSPVEGTRDLGLYFTDYFDSSWDLTYPGASTLFDLDGDGRVELIVTGGMDDTSSLGVLVVPIDATATVDVDGIYRAWIDGSILDLRMVRDMDGDDRPELAISHTTLDHSQGTSLYALPGTTTDYDDAIVSFSLAEVPRLAWSQGSSVGDLDGDEVTDLVINYAADGNYAEPYFIVYPGGL